MEKKKSNSKKKTASKMPASMANKIMTKDEYIRLAKKNGWPLAKPDVN